MTMFLRQLVDYREKIAEDFTPNERYLLSVAFKNYIGRYQISARVANVISKTPKYKKYIETLPQYKRDLFKRLRDQAYDIAQLFKTKAYKVAAD